VDAAGLPALIEAIKHEHGCEARWIESVAVHEKLPDGRTLWEGEVQVFELLGHPKAARVYAWSRTTKDNARRFHAVLDVLPVRDARTAVRAAILAELQRKSR
jgi:hypothetical protein